MQLKLDAEAVLADWRSLEYDLHGTVPGSAEWWRLHDEVERLRDEYQRLFDEALARGGPTLEPFPLATEHEAE